MRSKIMIMIVVVLLSRGSALAADEKGNYAVWGMGNQSCHAYNKARAKGEDDPFRFYLMGYLTGFNVHQDETYSITGEQEMPDIMIWFDTYCDTHAVHSFENAIQGFIVENYEGRLKSIPKPFQR